MELPRGGRRLIGTVLEAAGGTYRVHTAEGAVECSVRGKLKLDDAGPIAVGDHVEIEQIQGGACRITARLSRSSMLSRRSPYRSQAQVIVANVDQVAAVASIVRPPPDFRMIDRLFVVAELDSLRGFLVVNKVDLTENGEWPEELLVYARIGYPLLATSVKDGTGLGELRRRLEGRMTVFSGPSGVGKSSLANALLPGLRLRVGQVRPGRGRGRHTTSAVRLIPLPDGGYLADTPGIQHFEPGWLEPSRLPLGFREFGRHTGACRFADCRHRSEPGCAVVQAVETGDVDRRRYDSYLELLELAVRDGEGGRG